MIEETTIYRARCDGCGKPYCVYLDSRHDAHLAAQAAGWSRYGTEHVCPACDLNRVDVAPELDMLAGLQAPEPFSGLGPVDAALVVDVDLTVEQVAAMSGPDGWGEEARR